MSNKKKQKKNIKTVCYAALVFSEEAPAVERVLLAQNASVDEDEADNNTGSDLSSDWLASRTDS